MKAVILCAGLGTRLRPLTNTVPKVMVPINGKPLLQYHIEWLSGNNIKDIGINLFYLPDSIKEYFGDGSRFGVNIQYFHQESLKETAGDFRLFKDFIGKDQTIVIYGDNFFSLKLEDLINFHNSKKGMATVALRHWDDPSSKGIVEINEEAKILWFKEKPQVHEITSTIGNAGIYIFESDIFSYIPNEINYDFGKNVFPKMIENGEKIYGYELTDYHIDIGTPDTLDQARKEVPSIFSKRAIFLDRDGVLNKKPNEHDYVKNMNEYSWNDGAIELIKKIKDSGFKVIVISNQQGVAIGSVSKIFLQELKDKMMIETDGKIDDIFYCTHKISDACTCRKPSPGLIFAATYKYGIDLTNSYLIGDRGTDLRAAKAAGCKGILIESNIINLTKIFQQIL